MVSVKLPTYVVTPVKNFYRWRLRKKYRQNNSKKIQGGISGFWLACYKHARSNPGRSCRINVYVFIYVIDFCINIIINAIQVPAFQQWEQIQYNDLLNLPWQSSILECTGRQIIITWIQIAYVIKYKVKHFATGEKCNKLLSTGKDGINWRRLTLPNLKRLGMAKKNIIQNINSTYCITVT